MQRCILRSLALLVHLLVPSPLLAQDRSLVVGFGSDITLNQLITNIVNYLARSIVFVSIALFVIGALLLVISRGEGGNFDKGKGLMIGAVLGLAVTLGAAAIIRAVYHVLFSA